MSGNTFMPEAVERGFIELMRAGTIDLRSTIHHELPTLTPFGIDRALAIASEEITEKDRKRQCGGRAA